MPWSREDLTRLVELEAQQRDIDPRLAVALVEQESNFDPAARSPKGAIGLLQLMPKTAAGLKVDPYDVPQNISGGLDYLKQQLDAFGGDRAQALAAYNAGPMAVKAHRGVPPYKETQGYVSRILGKLGPASAEAGTLSAADTSRLAELEAAQAQSEPQQPTPPIQPPQASQSPAAAPDDATHAADTMARLRASQAGAAGLQPPPGDMSALAVGGGPSQQAPAVTAPLALLAMGGGLPGRAEGPDRERQILAEAGARHQRGEMKTDPAWRGVPPDAPPEESITAPSTMIPLALGFGIPGKIAAPALGVARNLVGESAPWVGRFVRPITEGISQTLGYGTGRTIETGKLPSPGELATEFAVTAGTGRILEDIGAIGADFLRRSKGGQAIINVDKFTQDAHAKWQADTQAAEEAARSQQKEVYDTAVIKAKTSQREYEMATRQRRQTIADNQTDYDQAVRAERESAYNARQQKIADEQAGYQSDVQAREQTTFRRQQEYTGAVQQQGQALTEARAIPARYKPATPSWVLYEKYGDAAKDTAFDLAPSNAALAELRVQRGVLPDGTMRPFPKAVEDIAASLEKATGPVPFETIRQEIRKLGPLTRHADGNIRGPAKQVMGVLADVLDTAPGANDVLKQANANFRREMAVKDMDEWLKTGHGIVSKDRFNREKINVATLFTKLDKTIADDSLFRGSFTPAERQALVDDFGKFAGTPNMPTRVPGELPPVPVPQPEYLPGSAPNVPGRLMHPPREPGAVALPPDVPVKQVPVPPGTAAPAPVSTYEVLGPRPRPAPGTLGAIGGAEYLASLVGIPPGAMTAVKTVIPGTQQARWLFAHGMLDARSRRMMQAAINGEGILHPQFYSVMLASLSPAERKAFERETGGVTDRRSASERAPGGAARQTD